MRPRQWQAWTALTVMLGIGGAGCAKRPLPSTGLAPGPRKAELDLWRAGSGGVKLYVEADLGDGKARLFLLDTGADICAMSAEVADELGLSPIPQRGGIAGMGGRVPRWSAVRVDVVELGPFDVHGVDFAVGVPGIPDRAGFVPVAGILGANVWQQFQVAIDYPANILELYRPGLMPTDQLAGALPMYLSRGHTRVAAELLVSDPEAPGSQRRVPWELEVDTGAVDILLAGNPPSAARLVDLATTGIEPVFGVGADDSLPLTSFMRTTRRVQLDGVVLGDVLVEESQAARWVDFSAQGGFAPPDMPGLIGHRYFDAHRLVLDFPGRRMALRPPERPAREQNIHAWGLAHARRPTRDEDVRLRARYLVALDRRDDASALLEGHIRRNPSDLESVVLTARLLRSSGQLEESDRLFSTLAPGELVDQAAVVEVVNSLWLRGDVPASLELAESAVAARPDAPVARVALADAAVASGDYPRARRALADANRLSEDPDGQLLRRAWVATREADLPAALTHFRRRLDLYPSGPFTPWLYAWAAEQADDRALRELAIADIDRAMARLHPGDGPLDFVAAAHALLGESSSALALQEQGATRDCSRADPGASQDNCEAWYAGLVGAGLDDAWSAIQRAVEAEPARSDYLDTLAVVAEARGDLEAARAAARQAASLSPADVYLLWQVRRLDAAPAPAP